MLNSLNLGDVTVTKNLLDAGVTQEEIMPLLHKHERGDWGELDKRDAALQAILCAPDPGPDQNEMIMSVWTIREHKIWITTHTGYHTCVMLREDY